MSGLIEFTPAEVAEYYRVRLPQLNQRGAEWRGPCPIHQGKRDSFAVDPKNGLWNCHSACGRGGDLIGLEEFLTGAHFKEAKAEVFRIVARLEASNGSHSRGGPAPGRIVATYDYCDENANLLYQAVRMDPKDFRQRRPDGKGGWAWNVKGVRLVLYRLPELLRRKTETVFVCEGEKDVHAIESFGLLATTNAMGAGKWRPEYSEVLRGHPAVVLTDNDTPGRKHAAAVAADLLRAGCEVRIIELPRGKDASDWIAEGGTCDELRGLCKGHPALTNGRLAEWRARWELADEEPRHQARAEAAGDWPEITCGNWPHELRDEAYHGPAGELVRAIEPHSEADPAAILIQFLVAFGNVIGRSAHFAAEADRHFMNLFTVLVGQTAKGRKGTSFGQVLRVLGVLDSAWSCARIMSGLSSGEGLIWAVRDEIRERAPIREKGRVIDYEEVVSDPGEKDKRLLVVEPEFARVLQVSERESNTLSAIIRQAWDKGNLQILTKKQSVRATEAHTSVIGHITKDELKRMLTDTAAGNGFANRFLWVCTRRSKLLPEGGAMHTVDFASIIQRVQAAADFARGVELIQRDEQARAIWREVYAELSEGKPGLLGSVTSRAEAQTMRLACIYALLDCSAVVNSDHMLAALEVWRYCEDSARFIFGDALGDATADEIIRELRQNPNGLTRNEIREHFNRNKTSAEIGRALGVLLEYGLARVERSREDESQRKPTERWFAVRGLRG
jgi:hypothetical protein